ncbi:hypothetical protein F3Y22_tig00110788pilonHSYRG00208 [Hibiscus syriacus]|uniref:CCHC-type domain-containing protein n=1 Tax=Hibiscus syriacus TaxID=106335 RepID=A0A6A2ZR77_HIBSY|nr:hypothetical protein F3Y22_tig00110788pilonHSYRG00208 [Hibiscus syriacus]
MATPKEHIELIRETKFSIEGEPNPLTEDLHQANAEDNEYLEGLEPLLEFVITSRDITATGAPATLLMFNNEKGFSSKNTDSVCSVGRSTKKGNIRRGYIGEKGIGFTSVFLICSQPYIFNNDYQIRFNEAPCPHCSLGYIVPEWIDENPTIDEIREVSGSCSSLPTTVVVLPLKPDKVNRVKKQLSSVEPELLLFLSKIKRLSIRGDNEDPSFNTVNGRAIKSETNFVTRKSINAESYTLLLSAEEETGKSGKRMQLPYLEAEDSQMVNQVTHEGIDEVNESKKSLLNHSYENFKMKPDEDIKAMMNRFSVIVNGLKGYGEVISNKNLLISSLLAHEMMVKEDEEREEKKNKKNEEEICIAFKSINESCQDSSDEVDEDDDEQEEEMVKLLKELKRLMISKEVKHESTKKKSPPICFNCQRKGHVKYECPLLKKKGKKTFVASWSDEDDSNDKDEVVNLCLMTTQEEFEVCESNGDENDDIQDALTTYEKGMGNL